MLQLGSFRRILDGLAARRWLSSGSRSGAAAVLAPGNDAPAAAFPAPATTPDRLTEAARALLSRRGETSGVALAADLLAMLVAAPEDERQAFCHDLEDQFGPDPDRLDAAIEQYRTRGKQALPELARATEPQRQELLRRLNQPPGAIARLLEFRAWMLDQGRKGKGKFPQLDSDFVHLFSSWFNRGFLRLEQITWEGKASVLEKLIRYEAVHDVRDWDDLRGRVQPRDRRCFGFFHPALDDEPLIFVEVALTRGIPRAISDILRPDRPLMDPEVADTAVFYSISNCQAGLRGVAFGNLLIKQVVSELRRALPNVQTFATLSPVPGFMGWLEREGRDDPEAADLLARLGGGPGDQDADLHDRVMASAAAYFIAGESRGARAVDSVAHFHLGNGARLEQVNWRGDVSPRGFAQSAGLMVNYVYDLDLIEERHQAYCDHGKVAKGRPFAKLVSAPFAGRRQAGSQPE